MKAKEIAKGKGMVAINAMVAITDYAALVEVAVKSKIDAIISGAGLPMNLPSFVQGTKVKIAPIVSSGKAAKLICKTWDRKFKVAPDFVVIEGYPGVGESTEGGSNQFLYQHARNFDWGMASAVGLENRRWTVKLQYEMSLGKESKNDNIGVNYNSLTLSIGYKLNVK